MTRKELLAVPKRKWDETLENVSCVYVIPSRRKHDSGYACMDFVAETSSGQIGFGLHCDDVSFEGKHFRMDCIHPSGIIRIWNRNKFSVSGDVSSISFSENQ